MKLGVVLFDAGTSHGLKVLLRPVQLKASGNGVHQALVALKDFQGAGYAAHSQERCMRGTKGCVGIRQPFPVGKLPGAGDAQGIVGSSADGDSVRDSVWSRFSALLTPAATA